MGEFGELSFCDLRAKEIINTADGRRLGRITDIIFSCEGGGEVRGIVVPYVRRLFFSRAQEIFIPWNCINKIGDDVILVNIVGDGFSRRQGRGKRGNSGCYDYGYSPCSPCDEPCPPPSCDCPPPRPEQPPHGQCCPPNDNCAPPCDRPDCDGKCEKCMLFDCAYRWKNH